MKFEYPRNAVPLYSMLFGVKTNIHRKNAFYKELLENTSKICLNYRMPEIFLIEFIE